MSDATGRTEVRQGEDASSERRRDTAVDDLMLDDNRELRAYIGRQLGEFRRQHKLRQADASEALGLSRSHLSNIELGRSSTGWRGLRALAEFYNLSLKDLVSGCSASLASGAVMHPQTVEETPVNNDQNKASAVALTLTDDELFLLRLLRILSTEEQRRISLEILNLMKERTKEIGNHEKKV